MALTPITRLGPYEIVAALGAGGPALFQPQTTTAADGWYRFRSLAPGGYAETFELSQFQLPGYEISALGAMGEAAGPGSLL